MAERDQEFVEYVAKQLVEKPEGVQTKRSVDEMGVLIELTVDKEDMGVIIGKEGKTAKAIRTLLRVLGAKNDARVNLKIVEPEGAEPREPKEVAAETEGEVAEDEAPVEVESDSASEEATTDQEAAEEADTDEPKEDDFVDI